MTIRKSLSLEAKRLLSGLSAHGGQHLTEVETDLTQTTFLLDEAIEKLTNSFMAIHEGVNAQQEAINSMLASGVLGQEDVARLTQLRDQIGQHVNAAVTGLQFQDMTTQLIGRTVRRVSSLREMMNAVEAESAILPEDQPPEEIANVLHKLNEVVEGQAEKLESILWKPVQQTHMESGDIELF